MRGLRATPRRWLAKRGVARVGLVAGLSLLAAAAHAAPRSVSFWYYSTVSSTWTGPLRLLAELNYDDAVHDAPIAVVMHGYSPSSGTLDNVRPQAQRLHDHGFFAISVAMRGRDGSAGVRDSGGLEIHDIVDAVEAAKEEYADFVDASNVHITGYSGGGGNAMSAVVRFPEYFRVASSYFGMSDYGFDPVTGWYNNGAAQRTATLDRDVGNPNTADPIVLDRYQARAANRAARNSRATEVHLFVNDNETICPPINHESFALQAGSNATFHLGSSNPPVYHDFNENGFEDVGERQYWPHGFPSAAQQAAAEQWYLDRLLAGEIPEPRLEASGTLDVAGFVVTRNFEVWLGDGQNAAGRIDYALGEDSASFSPIVTSSDPDVPISLVVESQFLPSGAQVETRINGELVDTFSAGPRRVYSDLSNQDVLILSASSAPHVPSWTSRLGSAIVCLLLLFSVVRRYLDPPEHSEA